MTTVRQRDVQRRSSYKVPNSEIDIGIPGGFGSIDPVLTREPARLLCCKEDQQARGRERSTRTQGCLQASRTVRASVNDELTFRPRLKIATPSTRKMPTFVDGEQLLEKVGHTAEPLGISRLQCDSIQVQ